MLDTDTVSFALRGAGHVAQLVERSSRTDLCVSAITVAELRYGAARRASERLRLLIDGFLADFTVMPFDRSCAETYGNIADDLATRGVGIGDLDTLIAAHALTLDLTLVTNNLKHFTRVRGLKVESWL